MSGAVTPYDASALATRLDPQQLEDAVAAIPADLLPLYLSRLDMATTLVNAAKKVITTRMVMEGQLGLTWKSPEGVEMRFERDRRSEWRDISGLFLVLERLGISAAKLGAAVSGIRVTDLRIFTEALPEADKRDALETIEQHREWREGTPHLVPVDSPYRRVAARTHSPGS